MRVTGSSLAILAFAAASVASVPLPATAQSTGVEALLDQAEYWKDRGQTERANEAYRRVLEIDPDNETAKKGLNSWNDRTRVRDVSKPSVPDVAPAPVRPQDPAGPPRAAGYKALDQGKLDSAESEFETALSKSPDDADTLGGLGLVRLREGRFEEARELLGQAAEKDSAERWSEALATADFYADLKEARERLASGDATAAMSIARRLARRDDGDRAAALGLLADSLEMLGRYEEAAGATRQALQVPGLDSAFAEQLRANQTRQEALLASARGDARQADQLFKTGIADNPGDPWIRYEYARFLLGVNRDGEARSILGQLSRSSQPESLYAAALLADQLGNTSEASRLMERIPAGGRTQEMQRFVAGLAGKAAAERARELAEQGQTSQALAGLQQVVATDRLPNSSKAEIATVMYELGDKAAASDLAQSLLSDGLDSAAAYEPVVRILAGTGKSAFAYGAIQQASKLAPPNPEGQATMARLRRIVATSEANSLREAGKYAESYDVLQAAWQEDPGDVEILSSLAYLYQAGGMPVQAAQTFRMVLDKTPQDEGALIGLVNTASAAGEMHLARDAFERAIRLSPDNYEVYLAGARMEELDGDDRAARRYLEKARDLYLAEHGGTASGGFSSGNPFARSGGQGGLTARPASVNPFDPAALAASSRQPDWLGGAPSGQGADGNRASTSGMGRPGSASPFAASGSTAASRGQGAGGGGLYQNADPVLSDIAADLEALEDETRPRVDVTTGYRDRSGEDGLSAVNELSGTARFSTGLADGRVFAKAHVTSIDAGEPNVNSLLKFGRNGLLQARGIVNEVDPVLIAPGSQHEAGIELSIGYEGDLLSVDVGSTPLGFEKVQVQGGVAFTPSLSRYSSARIWAERRPVTDSLLAYAGMTDPVSGDFWGAVMRTGGGVSASWERDGTGVYGDVSYYNYAGKNVEDNDSLEMNVGGYFRAYEAGASQVRLGVNGNFQQYDENQNVFTFGKGGYFSPQNFLSVSFPVTYGFTGDRLEAEASITPGYQSYEQERTEFFPTDPAAQQELFALRAVDADVQAMHDSSSETGFGINLKGNAYYEFVPGTTIGGELSLNTFGEYNEVRTMLGIRQKFGVTN